MCKTIRVIYTNRTHANDETEAQLSCYHAMPEYNCQSSYLKIFKTVWLWFSYITGHLVRVLWCRQSCRCLLCSWVHVGLDQLDIGFLGVCMDLITTSSHVICTLQIIPPRWLLSVTHLSLEATNVFSWKKNSCHVILISGIGLAPDRRQIIIWTNDHIGPGASMCHHTAQYMKISFCKLHKWNSFLVSSLMF